MGWYRQIRLEPRLPLRRGVLRQQHQRFRSIDSQVRRSLRGRVEGRNHEWLRKNDSQERSNQRRQMGEWRLQVVKQILSFYIIIQAHFIIIS